MTMLNFTFYCSNYSIQILFITSDGTDLEFRINSRVITVAVPTFNLDKHNKIWVDLQLKHIQNQSNSWNLSCGFMDVTGSWDLNNCIANTSPSDAATHCLCPNSGTFAVFLTARAVRVSSNRDRYIFYFIFILLINIKFYWIIIK